MKVLVLLQDEEINWMSLKKIKRGYLKSISLLKNTKQVAVQPGPNFFSFLDDVEAYQPDVVLFLDIGLQNPSLMKLVLGRTKKKPKFIFMLYGGFIQFTYSAWSGLAQNFMGFDISFICASDAYRNIQKRYFVNHDALQTIPYPIEKLVLNPPQKKSNEFHIIYAGRLSLQKNWLVLYDIFSKLKEVNGKKVFLHMAGPVDYSSLQEFNSEGFFEWQIEKFKTLHPQIKWHGQLREKELKNLMKTMNASISLSTFAYEDFGMVIPESLLSGLPVIATDWGGYKDFYRLFPAMVINLPIKKNRHYSSLDSSKVIAAIKKIDQGHFAIDIESVSRYFHPERVAKLLEDLMMRKTSFEGMTDKFPDVDQKFFNLGLK